MPPKAYGARVALIACIGLTFAGCATQAPQTTASQSTAPNAPASTTPSVDRSLSVDAEVPSADAEIATSEPEATPEPEASTGHAWPEADQDLWSQIREGFQIDANSDRKRVRRWTQQYATHQRHLKASLNRAKPFLWHIVQRIDERDMPTEIALLPIVESGYDASARSYMGASGLWQFMPGTADHMGLSRDWWYDGRNDVIASTEAALAYLDNLQRRYDGDWLLALAAYNAGPGRVDRALARSRREGGGSAYWDLDLPLETTDYVPKLLAIRRIMSTPSRFGIDWPTLDNTPRTRTVALPGQTEIAVAARMLDMSEEDLRRLNPAMQRWASAPRDGARLLVPAAKAVSFRAALAKAPPTQLVRRNTHTVRRGDVLGRIAEQYRVSVASLRQANHLRGDRIRVGQKLQIPATGAPGRPAPVAEPSETYIVQSGDSLGKIANRYNVSLATLRGANPGVTASIRPSQKIEIPGSATPPEPSTHVVRGGDSLWEIARDNDIAIADLRRWNRLGPNTALQPGQTLAIDGPAPLPDFYEVERGDSLWSIAARFSMQVTTLRSLNDMSSGSTIRPGQRLRLQPAVSSG
ncbi:membrane-bound lytic murein transglycosylase D [Salinisphaera dokdonensis CL-ES53]|uniref:Membrane-bound lytic murein transglycosylase D n=1 Tax=Salinisphaera dokdonensis CL-ES53 TaxID=1304272 RepID=A0ABV2B437_9GAMM